MGEAKTRPSGSSVDDYLASRASAEQLADCQALIALLRRVTGDKPAMWGPSIVGFGSYRYPLASGKHKFGKACLYFKRLSDLDQEVLEQLVVGSLTEVRRRHPPLSVEP